MFIHSPVDGHVAIMAIMNKVMNICMQVFVFLFHLQECKHVRMGLLYHILHVCLTFKKLSKMALPNYLSTSNV